MSSNVKRRDRYHNDPQYRAACIARANLRKRRLREQRDELERARGWATIDTAPTNEVIKLYDPAIFWPVYASWDAKAHGWVGIHYNGLIRPTHWQRVEKVPR